MSAKFLVFLAAGIAASSFSLAGAKAENICEREMHRASARYDVPLGILYAVGLTETGRKNSLQPYAMNIEGKAEFFPSQAAALRRFTQVHAEGAKLIDLGCMQINHYYHSSEFPSVGAMLQPSLNVDYAARFLKRLRVSGDDKYDRNWLRKLDASGKKLLRRLIGNPAKLRVVERCHIHADFRRSTCNCI
jgi:soluble lytic murein transglycosylase-like protein